MTQKETNPNQRIEQLAGTGTLTAISQAESAECFRLTFRRVDGLTRIAGFRIEAQLDDLLPDALAQIKQVLHQDSTYEFDVVSRVPFMPQIAIRLLGNSDPVVVIIDSERNKLSMVRNDHTWQSDVNPGSPGGITLNQLMMGISKP